METKELFKKIIQKKGWYIELGYTAQYAYDLKKRFNNGTLGEQSISKILLKLGYNQKKMVWFL